MKKQYVLTEAEVREAMNRLSELRSIALMNRDAGDEEGSSEFYFRAKGFEDALVTLGFPAYNNKRYSS